MIKHENSTHFKKKESHSSIKTLNHISAGFNKCNTNITYSKISYIAYAIFNFFLILFFQP